MLSDIPRIRIWNRIEKSSQNRIRMHPHDIHIKIEYKYKYLYLYFKRIWIWIIRMFSPGSILTWASPVQTQNCPCSNLTTCAAARRACNTRTMQTAKRDEGGKEREITAAVLQSCVADGSCRPALRLSTSLWPCSPGPRTRRPAFWFQTACEPPLAFSL